MKLEELYKDSGSNLPIFQITVLTMYLGQLFLVKKHLNSAQSVPGVNLVRVSNVDNFQGEENDIIILFLVRNNDEGHIGFLKIENRVNVALSRAKSALYVIGNADIVRRNSKYWNNVVSIFEESDALQDHLVLQCQNHKKTFSIVKEAKDFDKVGDGGCQEPCHYRLQCGHKCKRRWFV